MEAVVVDLGGKAPIHALVTKKGIVRFFFFSMYTLKKKCPMLKTFQACTSYFKRTIYFLVKEDGIQTLAH